MIKYCDFCVFLCVDTQSKPAGKSKGRYDPKSNIKEVRELTRRKPGRTTREKKPISNFTVRILQHGRVAKWLERLTAERNIGSSSRNLGPKLGCSLTIHTTANGYLVVTLEKLKAG